MNPNWFPCKLCSSRFSRKVLLILHQQRQHPPTSANHQIRHHQFAHKIQMENYSDEPLDLTIKSKFEIPQVLYEKEVKDSYEPLTIPSEIFKNSNSNSKSQLHVIVTYPKLDVDAIVEKSQIIKEEMECPIVALDMPIPISIPLTPEQNNLELEKDLQLHDLNGNHEGHVKKKKETKAVPCVNFLDHVTTRLIDKRIVTYICNFCGDELDTLAKVKLHVPIHIEKTIFPCERSSCTKSFESIYDQLRHEARHSRKRKKAGQNGPTSVISGRSDSDHELKLSEPDRKCKMDNFQDSDNSLVEMSRYCLCHQFAYGLMVKCDRRSCPKKWFHFECVGLIKEPNKNSKWFCPQCRDFVLSKKRRSKRIGGRRV